MIIFAIFYVHWYKYLKRPIPTYIFIYINIYIYTIQPKYKNQLGTLNWRSVHTDTDTAEVNNELEASEKSEHWDFPWLEAYHSC